MIFKENDLYYVPTNFNRCIWRTKNNIDMPIVRLADIYIFKILNFLKKVEIKTDIVNKYIDIFKKELAIREKYNIELISCMII